MKKALTLLLLVVSLLFTGSVILGPISIQAQGPGLPPPPPPTPPAVNNPPAATGPTTPPPAPAGPPTTGLPGGGATGGTTGGATGGLNGGGGTGAAIRNPITATNLYTFLVNALDLVVLIGTYVLAMMIIWTGFLFVTAQGDTKKIESARFALVATVVGGAIILGAKALASVIYATITQL